VLIVGLGALVALQQPARGPLRPCQMAGLVALCATIHVPENRAAPRVRTLGLRVVVIAPDSGTELPDPIVVVPGGPGGGVIDGAQGWASILQSARGHRAMILLDPRGAALSGALDCDFGDGPSHPASYVTDFAPPDKVKQCAAALARRADLTQYHTEAIADDLADVLTALGYTSVNLVGVSGGTRQAFVFASRYPKRVRTLTLGGVVPPDYRLPLHYAQDLDRSLELLFADCARDAACHAAYPDPKGELVGLLQRLGRAPARVPLEVPRLGRDTARVTRNIFAERIRRMLYSRVLAAQVLYVIHQAAAGDFLPFVAPLVPGLGAPPGGDGVAMGHYLSVTCSEDVDRISPAERAEAARGTLLGDYRVQQQVAACALWPHAHLPETHFQFTPLALPALLISGDADPVTPPRWAQAMQRYLPSAKQVVFPTGWHVPIGTPCGSELVSQFIVAGNAQTLDVSCAATLRRSPFKLPNAP